MILLQLNYLFFSIFLVLFSIINFSITKKNKVKTPTLNGYFLDRISYTIYIDTPFIQLWRPLEEVKNKFQEEPDWKQKRQEKGLKLKSSKGDLKLEVLNARNEKVNHYYSKFYLKIVSNLSMQCFFNANVFINTVYDLYDDDSIVEYLHEFNMIPFIKSQKKLPPCVWLKNNRRILIEQLKELYEDVNWSKRYYENFILKHLTSKNAKQHIHGKPIMVTFGCVEIAKDYRDSSPFYWRPILDNIQAKWDRRNSSLTNYERWWITSEEKQEIRQKIEKNQNTSIKDEILSKATGKDYKIHLGISEIDKKYGYDISQYEQYIETHADSFSQFIEPESDQKKNQIHFYHKMISQARMEFQANKDRRINAILNAFIMGDLTPEYTADLLIEYTNITLNAVNFSDTRGNKIAVSKLNAVYDISRSTNLDPYLILKLFSSTGFDELTSYDELDENNKATIRKRNRKLAKCGFITWNKHKQKYEPTQYLLFLKNQIKKIEEQDSLDIMDL